VSNELVQATFPTAKASAAIGAGAASSALAIANENVRSFLPVDLGGWMALVASTVAVVYTLHLLGAWYWGYFWRPFLERKGWLKPRRRVKRIVYMDEEDAGNPTEPAALT
jgi:hypothetical protein